MRTKSKAKLFGRFAALVAAGALVSCSASGPELLRDGARLIEERKYAAAVRKLEKARDRLPQLAGVWNHLGVAYHGDGRTAEAVQAYTQALALDRNLAAARFNLGCLRLEQGQFTAAVSELTTFVGLQPKSIEGWLALAAAQTHARAADAAERSLQTVLRLDATNADAWNRLGLLHWNRRRVRDAQTAFESALRHEPGFAPALLNLAVLHHTPPGDRATALAYYRKYLAVTPRPEDFATVQATARQLEAELAPAAKPPASAPIASVVASPAEPPPSAKAQPKSEPAAKPAPVLTVVAPERKAAEVKAAPVPRPGASAPVPPSATAPAKVEVVQLAAEAPIKPASAAPAPLPPKAKTAASKPAAPTPAPAPGAGTVPTAARPVEAARPTLLQRMNPRRWFGDEPAGQSGSPRVAAPRAPERVTEEPPAEAAAPVERGTARYAYERPATPKPGNRADAQRHFNRGVEQQREGRVTQAITEYLAAIAADPAYFEANYNLGLAAADAGHYGRSLSAYERALSIRPTDLNARFNFALVLQKAGHPRDAANELEAVLAAQPVETRAHLALANLYAQELGQDARARAHYLQVLEAQPRHPQAAAIQQWLNTHP